MDIHERPTGTSRTSFRMHSQSPQATLYVGTVFLLQVSGSLLRGDGNFTTLFQIRRWKNPRSCRHHRLSWLDTDTGVLLALTAWEGAPRSMLMVASVPTPDNLTSSTLGTHSECEYGSEIRPTEVQIVPVRYAILIQPVLQPLRVAYAARGSAADCGRSAMRRGSRSHRATSGGTNMGC